MMSLIKKISLPLILALVIISVWSFTKPFNSNKGLIEYVDPFIGSGGHGHVFVGATVPFGGVQVGPTNFNKGWDWSSSYHHTDSIVKGFCHLNVSGTGMSDLGELTIMPATGELKYNAGNQDNHMSGYSSLYRKNTEINTVGYYKVDLERYDINVELTASERVGFHRYTYPNSDNSRVIIDLGEGSADRPTETYLKKIDDTTFEGYRFSSGWARDQREYFTLVISKPVKDFILYDGGNKHDTDELKGEFVKGFLEFETKKNEEIYVKMGVSTVSSKNALENLNAEIPHWDFDKVKLEAENKWNQELSKINIKTEDLKRKRVFYTAMYHTMIAPNLYQDVNGEYRGTDKVVYKDTTFTNYTLFSLWDTYRAAHPLYTITHPERVSDMVNSMLKIFDHQGKSERIKNFPYPRQYATLGRYFVWIFLILLPFGLVPEFDRIDETFANMFPRLGDHFVWLAVPFCTVVSWVFHTMEAIGENTENPFEGGPNDVPITDMSRGIEIDIRQLIDDTDIPAPYEWKNDIVM